VLCVYACVCVVCVCMRACVRACMCTDADAKIYHT